jgi:pimeloyl-ACP methyl ester carboxylesterase
VAAFALIHGGGGSAWDWHLVAPALRERGHDPVAVDLPSEDESAGWPEHTDTVVRAVGDRSDLVVVGHSLGGFTAPLVCARLPAKLLVLVAGMIPSPGEFFSDWWRNSGYEETGYAVAAHGLARDPDEVPPLPRRPHVLRHAHERLGIEADEIGGGHYISLSRPRELAEHLHAYAAAMQ